MWKHVFVTSSGETYTFYCKMVIVDEHATTGTLFARGPKGLYRKFKFPDMKDFMLVELFLEMADDHSPYIFYAADEIKKYDGEMAFLMMVAIDAEDAGFALLGDHLADIQGDYSGAFNAYEESANDGNIYAICKLGCLYAEGKGCVKDLAKAKELFEDAAYAYPEAEKYLDQYGLR